MTHPASLNAARAVDPPPPSRTHPACPLLTQVHKLLREGHTSPADDQAVRPLDPAQRSRLAIWLAETVGWVQLLSSPDRLSPFYPWPPQLPQRMDYAYERLGAARRALLDILASWIPAGTGNPLVAAAENACWSMETAWNTTQPAGGYQDIQQVADVAWLLASITRAAAAITATTAAQHPDEGWSRATDTLQHAFHTIHTYSTGGQP